MEAAFDLLLQADSQGDEIPDPTVRANRHIARLHIEQAIVLGIALQDRVVPLVLVFAFSVGDVPEALCERGVGECGPPAAVTPTSSALECDRHWGGGRNRGRLCRFGSLSEAWPPRLQAFGAGALLAMTAETMIPEAVHDSPRFSGFARGTSFWPVLLVDATTR